MLRFLLLLYSDIDIEKSHFASRALLISGSLASTELHPLFCRFSARGFSVWTMFPGQSLGFKACTDLVAIYATGEQ